MAAVSANEQDGLVDATRLDGMRGVIARNLVQSLHDMAQLTLYRTVDASALVRFRGEFNQEVKPSFNDLLLAATANALTRHPSVNATLEDATIYRWRRVDIGMAVAIDQGLVVPVIRRADELALEELQRETERVGTLARSGDLAMSDIAGATFTVSNLGGLGIDGFTPIVNPPQVAILGIGRLRNDEITLSLTIDHRALDGAPGARFLQDLAEVMSDPSRHF
jgi:pyruvate dehydrogenase E2 component (dihydrolipoamide acetyltransferase)